MSQRVGLFGLGILPIFKATPPPQPQVPPQPQQTPPPPRPAAILIAQGEPGKPLPRPLTESEKLLRSKTY